MVGRRTQAMSSLLSRGEDVCVPYEYETRKCEQEYIRTHAKRGNIDWRGTKENTVFVPLEMCV